MTLSVPPYGVVLGRPIPVASRMVGQLLVVLFCFALKLFVSADRPFARDQTRFPFGKFDRIARLSKIFGFFVQAHTVFIHYTKMLLSRSNTVLIYQFDRIAKLSKAPMH